MRSRSRTRLTALNLGVGVFVQVVLMGLSVVTRTVFVRTLAIELLGVQALFLNLITLVAVVELGLNTSVMFALYKPLAVGDQDAIAGIVGYCRHLYRRVSAAAFTIGLALTPVVRHLVTTDEPIEHLELYYLIMVVGASLTYLMAHRVVLLMADQRSYVAKLYYLATELVRAAGQLAALLVFRSFLGYLAVQAGTRLLYNLLVYRRVGRDYPAAHGAGELDSERRESIAESIKAMLVYRISGALLNNTDGVIISLVVGTVALGYYSNYALVIGTVVVLAESMLSGLSSGVGNLVAEGDTNQIRSVFWELNQFAYVGFSVASLVLLVTVDDLIRLWLGSDYVLEPEVLWAAVANFYLVGMMQPLMAYRTGTGLFRDTKYILVLTAGLNIVLSLVLGRTYGVAGVLAATVLARLCTNAWFEPWKLFRNHLGGRARDYFWWQLKCLALIGVQAMVYRQLPLEQVIGGSALVVLRGVIVAVLATLVALVVFARTDSLDAMRNRVALAMTGRLSDGGSASSS